MYHSQEKTNAVKAFAREQCEVAAQLQRQQQQLQHQQPHQQVHSQHQHHHQQQHHYHQQLQLRPTLHMGSKIGSGSGGPMGHSTVSLAQLGRGLHSSFQHHPHQHHSHQQRHVSPPLLLSSPHAAPQHNHLTHRGGITAAAAAAAAVAVTATPPTTPGDRSPPSPNGGGGGGGSGKLNRSQHLPRETSGSVSPGLPAATLDLSSAATTNSPHELSTLV